MSLRVVVAMSGGVDSSTAAALLVESGHEVIGLSMQLYDQRESPDAFGSCCSIDDLHDARRVAHRLGIPHYLVQLERPFEETVVRNFVREYASGRTPIPCVHCNADLKFHELLERAAGLGASAVATGHYARVAYDEVARRYRLYRGVDRDKDQSYFLFSLDQDQLARAMFPVGHLTKREVREVAGRHELDVAQKPDSHEICFIPDGDAAGFVERALGADAAPGDIVDSSGRTIGHHRGVHRFTVGQRKGLGVATGQPMYVLRLEPDTSRVIVGSRDELGGRELSASSISWISGTPPPAPARVSARIRHRHRDAVATVTTGGNTRAQVVFDEPQIAITPGQAVVFYDGEEVLGGGWIEA